VPLLRGNQVAETASPAILSIDLQDALSRARKYGAQIQTANIAAEIAHEDKRQAKAAALPSLNALNQFIYTEGNGTPSGVFIANDGVHVYNEQAVLHQELFSLVRRGEIRRAAAAEAVARARADVAARGLNATVVQDYYAIASAERKLKNAQLTLTESERFLEITQKQEQGGEVAHADVIKAQLSVQQHHRDVEDAQLGVEKAKVALGVLILPNVQQEYEIVDDLDKPVILPTMPEALRQAARNSPDVRAAQASVAESRLGVSVARYAYLPSFALDFFYGIDANQFAARTNYPTEAAGHVTLPQFEVAHRQNLGYVGQVTLTVPIWSWGSIGSKVKQASLRERQAEVDLSLSQKQAQADLATAYREAQTASSQVASLRTSSDLAAESLRLTLLRYQAGEATALEVVDAQTTASQSRAGYSDGLLRYRVAVANLQILTGNF
jgi:outer membrane protein TolC